MEEFVCDDKNNSTNIKTKDEAEVGEMICNKNYIKVR